MAELTNGQPRNNQHLNIDNVVSSMPELGPTPPDGGYGWLVLLSAIVTQVTIPSIIVMYGILLLFLNLQKEYEEDEKFGLWDKSIVLVPILITVFWLLFEPWSRTIVLISNRPRIVSISGIFLIGAGLMLSNFSAEADDNDVMINIFSGIIIGMGSSLTTQQADILLKHYFRKKLLIVQTIYKTSITFGAVLMTIITGALCAHYGASLTLIIIAGIVMQNCVSLTAFTRPVYITKPLQQNYNILHEASEDEDEEIYPSQVQVQMDQMNDESQSTENNNKREVRFMSNDDDQDEDVINTFNTENTQREVVLPVSPVLTRMEPTPNPFGSNFVNDMDRIESYSSPPEALYRETTVAYDGPSNVFGFDIPAPTIGTIRRTADTKKNISIMFSVLRDGKFYAYTYTMLSVKYSMLVMGLLFPAYVSQQVPDLDMWTVTGIVTTVYIAAMCLNIVSAFVTSGGNRKITLRLLSIFAVTGFLGLAMSSTRSWLSLNGILASFSITAIYIFQQPIFDTMMMEFDASVISITSNFIIAVHILVIMLIHNYEYSYCFEIAGFLNILVPFLSFYL